MTLNPKLIQLIQLLRRWPLEVIWRWDYVTQHPPTIPTHVEGHYPKACMQAHLWMVSRQLTTVVQLWDGKYNEKLFPVPTSSIHISNPSIHPSSHTYIHTYIHPAWCAGSLWPREKKEFTKLMEYFTYESKSKGIGKIQLYYLWQRSGL